MERLRQAFICTNGTRLQTSGGAQASIRSSISSPSPSIPEAGGLVAISQRIRRPERFSFEVEGEQVTLVLDVCCSGVKRSDAVKSADALVLVYSITDRESFKALSGLRDDVLKARDDDGGPPLVLLGQDSHKEFGRKVKREEADSLAKKWNKAPRRKLNRTLPFRLFSSRQEETTTLGASAPLSSTSTTTSSPPGGGLGSPWSGSVSNPVTTHTSRTQQFTQADDPKAGRALRLSLRSKGSSDAKDSGKEARKKEKEKAAKEKGEKKEKGWLKQTQRRAKKKRSNSSNKKKSGADDAAKPVGRRKEDMRMLGQRQTMMKLSQRMESMSTIKRPQAPPRPPRHGIDGLGGAAGVPPSGAVEEEAPPHMQEAQSFADLAATSARTVIRGFSPEQAYGMLITTSGPAIDVIAEVASKEKAITDLLTEIGLLRYKENLLQAHDLRLSDLPLLKEWDLDRLGITLMGHKKKLLKAFHQSLNRIANGGEGDPLYWVMEPSELSLGKRLGGGNFGEVFVGKWRGMATVAIKQLREVDTSSLQEEAKIMSSVSVHPNVVTLYGVALSPGSAYLVTEFIPDGSLDSYLKSNINRIHSKVLLRMCRDVAAGMDHLHSHRIVHRDLATRNLLLKLRHGGEPVCDFGLSRTLEASEYYWATKSLMPIRWSSPEALKYRKFTPKSDVWSFGVVMWEIFSFGQVPYSALTNSEVMTWLDQGERLPRPNRCPEAVYRVMLKCWHLDPKRRPAFSELFSVLERILEADDAEASSASTSSPLSSTTSSPHQRPPLASASSMAAYGPGGGMLSTSGPVSTTAAGAAGDAEDESGEGSGSVDLAANMWGDSSRHASGVLGSPTTAAKNEHGSSRGRSGKSESGERTRSGRKASREDQQTTNGRVAMRELGGSMAEYGSGGGGGEADTWPAIVEREGSTIEQIMRDTTRMAAEAAPIVPEMELRFKEELARGDARACPCMIRVGAHVWCGAPGGRIDIYHAMTTQHVFTIMGHFNTRVLRLVLVGGLVWSCDENLIRIWDPLTFKQVCELTEHSGMGASAGLRKLQSSFESSAAARRGSQPSVPTTSGPATLSAVWTSDTSGKIIIWQPNQKQPTVMKEIVLREEPISCMCQVGNAVWLGAEKRIYCVDLNTHAMFNWTAHQRTVNDLHYENGLVWSSANDGKLKVWNGGETPQTVNLVWETDVEASVNCFARVVHPKYPTAVRLCAGAVFGTVTMWDAKTREKKQQVGQQKDVIKSMLWVEETLTLWTASFDHTIHLWQLTVPRSSSASSGAHYHHQRAASRP
ncbi:protein kinase domain containing protein [Acanthamoeba castellanii str. Neff]|uniref:Protein kinase domain containing protein n=1 Tax=Acanthamoeba castellanii (strain ATCC 30010 / Neff) TaxID=1257118 RepID=L8H1R3_ACACF|nr:protein kinase domain containing protein [Acanthamoeba castellanii str. Neff]ELR19142.1 protein kinase domain containing protein [Acanthamoeba castellanii str. Neff]